MFEFIVVNKINDYHEHIFHKDGRRWIWSYDHTSWLLKRNDGYEF